MLALYIVGGMVAYFAIGSMVYGYYINWDPDRDRYPSLTQMDGVLAGVFWPFVLPVWAGYTAVKPIGKWAIAPFVVAGKWFAGLGKRLAIKKPKEVRLRIVPPKSNNSIDPEFDAAMMEVEADLETRRL